MDNTENTKLKPCPCGETPRTLHLTPGDGKWAWVSGDCCNEWTIEFITKGFALDTDSCMEQAIKFWNEATRGNK